MTDIDLHKTLLDKYTFEIHEALENNKLGKLAGLLSEMKTQIFIGHYKYTTSLGDKVVYYVKANPTTYHKELELHFNDKINVEDYKVKEILKLQELMLKYL